MASTTGEDSIGRAVGRQGCRAVDRNPEVLFVRRHVMNIYVCMMPCLSNDGDDTCVVSHSRVSVAKAARST